MKEDITQKILSIIGNFNLSESMQLKELTSLYMKQQEEIERLNNIINKAIKYIEEAQQRDEDKECCSIYIPKLLEILDKGE